MRFIGLTIILWVCCATLSMAQIQDFKYFKSQGVLQFSERNFMDAVFNLQRAYAYNSADQGVADTLAMCLDSIGNKEQATKIRSKMAPVIKTAVKPKVDTIPNKTAIKSTDEVTIKRIKKREIPLDENSLSLRIVADTSISLRDMGNDFLHRELYDSAAICYRLYLAGHMNDTDARYDLATSYYYLKKYHQAIDLYQSIVQKGPERPEIFNWLGVCELMMGNYLGARDYFKQCLRYDREFVLAYFYLGKTQYELEDYGTAAQNLERALQSMPEDPDARLMLADIYYASGKLDKAKKLYERLYTTNKRSDKITFRLGDICVRLGQWQSAVNYFESFIAIVPNSVEALKKLGIAYYNIDKFTYAMESFDKASKQWWDDKELMLYGAIAANKLGNYQKALDYANRALSLDTKYARAYYQLGVAYKGLGQNKASKENFKRAADIDANNVTVN